MEPFAFLGAVPPLRQFAPTATGGGGGLRFNGIPSYSMQVPNILYKMGFQIAQSSFEFDQTRTVVQLSQAAGERLAEFPDQLFCKRILAGSSTTSATVVFDVDGKTYTTTFDGKPFFSNNHLPTKLDGSTQSNIILGNFPITATNFLAQDIATSAQQMVIDFTQVLNAIKKVQDNQGMPIYPTIDTKKAVTVVVPPLLEPVAALAFRSGPPTVIAQTTNIAVQFVKEVLTSGYLAGFSDPEDPSGSTYVNPLNDTDWYVFITTDFVKPFYVQLFKPAQQNDLFPRGYNADNLISAVTKANGGISVDQATVFASTRIDTTFNKIGANADYQTITTDSFTVSARMRGNIVYGPWYTGWRVKPTNGI